jgi:hypothetical protein
VGALTEFFLRQSTAFAEFSQPLPQPCAIHDDSCHVRYDLPYNGNISNRRRSDKHRQEDLSGRKHHRSTYSGSTIVANAALARSYAYDQDTTLRDLSSEENPQQRDMFHEDLTS